MRAAFACSLVLLAGACATQDAPAIARRAVQNPATASTHASDSEPIPREEIDDGECLYERESIAKRMSLLRTSARCLQLLEAVPDLQFLESISVTQGPSDPALDLRPLSNASRLSELRLDFRSVPDLEPLRTLSSLRSISIDSCVVDLDLVEPLAQVESLILDRSCESSPNLSALAHLTSLRELRASQPVDLSELAKVRPDLRSLDVLIDDPAKLAPFSALEHLALGCLERTDRYPPLANLRSVRVSCYEQPTSLVPLRAFPGLESIDVSDTGATSLAPLRGMTHLAELNISRTPIASLDPLAGCKSLEWLDLFNTQVRSLAPLASLPKLDHVDAGATPLTSVAPLAANRSLRSLYLAHTRVRDITPLARIRTLTEVMVPGDCDRTDVARLHAARPDLKIRVWCEAEECGDMSCW